MKLAVLATATLVVFVGSQFAAHAQIDYRESALNGCYAHLGTSVDTGSTTVGANTVGTLCFDGKGNIVGSAERPGLSGHVGNKDGTMETTVDQTGTYRVTNYPGDGMGWFIGKCTVHRFVLREVDANGLAHGFSDILIKRSSSCKNSGPVVSGGGGEYLGPLR